MGVGGQPAMSYVPLRAGHDRGSFRSLQLLPTQQCMPSPILRPCLPTLPASSPMVNCGRPTRHPRDVTSSASCRAGERMRACLAASAASRCACASFSTAARRRMSASSRLLGSKLSPACGQRWSGVPQGGDQGGAQSDWCAATVPQCAGRSPRSEGSSDPVKATAWADGCCTKQRSRRSCCTHLAQLHAAVVLAQAQRPLCRTVVRLLSRRVRAAPVN